MATKKEKTLSFEEALEKLEESAELLRNGDASLEESVDVYNKSVEYYKQCKDILKDAHQKIEIYNPETNEVENF
ncbi:MAG: exodeoxyribonuclease VII small subunit [Clostridia bacterium]|nr:exodeoxyribonuclease VII small subunit [Clostridia bacterium]